MGDHVSAPGFIAVKDKAEYDLWDKAVNAAMGYPNAETKTERYTELLVDEDGKMYAQIDNKCPAAQLVGATLHPPSKINRTKTDITVKEIADGNK